MFSSLDKSRSNAPVLSMVARDPGKFIGLPSSRLVYRHSREPHTPIRAISKEKRATSATSSKRIETNSPETTKINEEEYSDDEDIGFTLSSSTDKTTRQSQGPEIRDHTESFPKDSDMDTDDSDKEDDDFPKNSIFSLELEDPITSVKPIEKTTRKKGITVITKKSHSMEKTSGAPVINKPPGFPDKSNLPAKETHRQRKKKTLSRLFHYH